MEYDVERVIADMHDEKLELCAPYWNDTTKRLLRTGKISNGDVLNRAMKLCKEGTGECNWPHIPERYWEQALKEIFAE